MLLLKRMRFFGGLTIVLSVVNVLLLTSAKGTVQQQDTENKELYSGIVTTAPNTNPAEKSGMKAPNNLLRYNLDRSVHLRFSIIHNIILCILQLVFNRKKINSSVTAHCFVFGGACCGISFITFNVMFLQGILSNYLYACLWLLSIVNFCLLYQTYWALEEVFRIEQEQADNVLLIVMDGSQTLNTDHDELY